MNAPFVVSDALPDWDALAACLHAWRGRCLEQFARAEAAASEALLRLSQDERAGPVDLPRLVGCRYGELERVLVATDDPSARRAVAALRDLREHDRLRAFLCHGTSAVLVDRRGACHFVLRLLAFRKGEAARDELLLSREAADAMFKALQRCGQRLASLLGLLAAS